MTRSVAVTGATGFIGRALVERLLREGWRVRLLVRRMPQFAAGPAGPVELVLGDLADGAALRRLVDGVDAVAHLAGLIKARREADYFAVNADGTTSLVAACIRQTPLPRFVLLSSLAAREPGLSAYAASKRAGEQALAGCPLPWVAVRAPVVYGPGDRETLAFFRVVRRRIAPVAGDGAGRVSMIHVDDLAAALVRLIEGPLPEAGAYELDDGHAGGYSLRDLAGAAAMQLGVRPVVVGIPRWVLSGVAAMQQKVAGLTGKTAMLSPDKVGEIFHPDWVVHDNRLGQAIDWHPRVALADGFADTIAWYRQERWL